MRHLARGMEKGRTPGVRLSDCHLKKQRLINSLETKVAEKSWSVSLRQCPLVLLNHQDFADTIGKPVLSENGFPLYRQKSLPARQLPYIVTELLPVIRIIL